MEAKDAVRELMKKRITNTWKAALDEAEHIMDADDFNEFRHIVLDCGNNQIRMLMDDLSRFEIKWGVKREIFIVNPKHEVKEREADGNR